MDYFYPKRDFSKTGKYNSNYNLTQYNIEMLVI